MKKTVRTLCVFSLTYNLRCLSPALGAHFAVSRNFDAGERGEPGWNFYPGRRAQALALGYPTPPLQG